MKNSSLLSLLVSAVSLVAVATAPIAAQAANITWQAANNITGDTDVSTAGSLIAAYNFGSDNPSVPAATINGVTFQPFPVPDFSTPPTTVGNFSVVETDGPLFSDTTLFGSTSAPFTGMSSSYQDFLKSAIYTSPTFDIVLTMNNLVIGQTYQFQWWTNTSEGGFSGNFVTASAGNSLTLSPNTTGADGGLGQYGFGTFVADSTTQTVSFSGDTTVLGPVLNGFQLRALSVSAPEPSTLALLLFGAVGVAGRAVRVKRRN